MPEGYIISMYLLNNYECHGGTTALEQRTYVALDSASSKWVDSRR
jgi:hypothetical protein